MNLDIAPTLAADKSDYVQLFLNGLTDQVYVKDAACRFVAINNATARFFNKPATDVIGKTDYDFFPRPVAEKFFAEEKALLASGNALVNRETRIDAPTGGTRWVLTTKTALRDNTGKIVGLIGINYDITERRHAQEQLNQLNADLARGQLELLETYEHLKKTQSQLIQSEKLETIGRLAAGIAHEVRNPLATLLMGIGYLEDSLTTNAPVTDAVLGDMREAVHRADAIICELLDFSSPRQLDFSDEDVSALAERALLLVRHELSHRRVEIVREFAPGLPAQRVDRIRIEQVFVNLLINAIHAMPAGGLLTVRTALTASGGVVAEVNDTGHGIAVEHLRKVFDPFFTTKPVGIGSGMGLAVAKSIMTRHEGDLTLTNRPEGGVCARIIFHNKKEATDGT